MGSVYSCFEACTKGLEMLVTRLGIMRPYAAVGHASTFIKLQDRNVVPKVPPRETPTSKALKSLRSVRNARDLAEACSSIAPGRIFRSASPTNANEQDIYVLREVLGVKHLVDLRSDTERKNDGDPPVLIENAEVRKFGPKTGQVETYVRNGNGSQYPVLTVHHVSLLEREKYQRALIRRMPYSTAAYVILWKLLDEERAKAAAIREINKAGLPGLYECILETSGPEIRHIMETVSGTVETGSPTLFFCRMGKDRTGLVAALILAACGASDAEIISDYVRSDDNAGVALGGMESEKEMVRGLDVDAFSRAPAEAMQITLQYMEERYGGLRGYLDYIGFGRDAQMKLAKLLAPRPGSQL